MKQKLLYILFMITALLGGNTEAWAQTTSYVLNESAEVEIMNRWSSSKPKTYTLNGPAHRLSFQYKGIWSTTGYITITAKDSNGNTLKTATGSSLIFSCLNFSKADNYTFVFSVTIV